MATTKYLDQNGLAKFYELIDEKYIATNELNGDKGLAWAVSNQAAIDAATEAGTTPPDAVYKEEVKLGEGMEFDQTGAITASGLSAATDVKLGTIKTWVDTYDENNNPTGTDIGTTMVASDPVGAPTVLDRIQLVGVQGTREKGKADGYCPLDENALVPTEYLPSYVDDIIEGYYRAADDEASPAVKDGFFKTRTGAGTDLDPYVYNDEYTADNIDKDMLAQTGKIYLDIDTKNTYRWSGSAWVEIASGPVSPIPDAFIEGLFA